MPSVKGHRASASATAQAKADLMYEAYQQWALKTYGDSAKTKTVTRKKYNRIVKILKGEESSSVENSKFRFWVKAKGFRLGPLEDGGSDDEEDSLDAQRQEILYVACSKAQQGASSPKNGKNGDSSVGGGILANGNVYKRVAVVEKFYDIIYNVHVEMDGRSGKHAGQKRTYRAVAEMFAFLPREAVTRFLMSCADCQKRMHLQGLSPVPISASPPPNGQAGHHHSRALKRKSAMANCSDGMDSSDEQHLPAAPARPITLFAPYALDGTNHQSPASENSLSIREDDDPDEADDDCDQLSGHLNGLDQPARPIPIYARPIKRSRTSQDSAASGALDFSKTATQHPGIGGKRSTKLVIANGDVCKAEEESDDDRECQPGDAMGHHQGTAAAAVAALALMASAEQSRVGDDDVDADEPDDELVDVTSSADAAGSSKDVDHQRQQPPPKPTGASKRKSRAGHQLQPSSADGVPKSVSRCEKTIAAFSNGAANLTTSTVMPAVASRDSAALPFSEYQSVHPGSAVMRDDDEDEMDEIEDDEMAEMKADQNGSYDPERLKAFNMFCRLFVDENLDRMVPISRQPKDKIQAIIDSCTRQFPELADRARKRIRTYLKSCRRTRRNKLSTGPVGAHSPSSSTKGDPDEQGLRNGLSGSGGPGTHHSTYHMSSAQAEQILATACDNEYQNAKRMRLGLPPIAVSTAQLGQPGLNGRTPLFVDDLELSSSGGHHDRPSPGAVMSKSPGSQPFSTGGSSGAAVQLLKTNTSHSSSSLLAALVCQQQQQHQKTKLEKGTDNGKVMEPTGLASPGSVGTNGSNSSSGSINCNGTIGRSSASGHGLMASFDALRNSSTNGHTIPRYSLNPSEMAAVKQLIAGYRESAAFLLRSADELENLLLQQP